MLEAFKTNGSSPPKKDRVADVLVQYSPGDTVGLVVPVTDTAQAWLEDRVQRDAHRLGRVLIVEHRYIEDLVVGMAHDGLVVAAL